MERATPLASLASNALPLVVSSRAHDPLAVQRLSPPPFIDVGKSKTQQGRYAAHILLMYIFTCESKYLRARIDQTQYAGTIVYIFYLVKREMGNFVTLRHEFLVSREHSQLAQSKTVLLTGIPKNYQSLKALAKFTSYLGGVQNIWLVRDLGKDIPKLYERRDKACAKLEAAETGLMKKAAKQKLKADKKAKKSKGGESGMEMAANDQEFSTSLAEKYIAKKDRPTHRQHNLPLPIPFYGKKVDSIDWAKEEILTTDRELTTLQGTIDKLPPQGAAFIQFNSQIGAHMFQQCTGHDLPLRMSGRYIEVSPEDVIWANLNINPYQAKVCLACSPGSLKLSHVLSGSLYHLLGHHLGHYHLLGHSSSLCRFDLQRFPVVYQSSVRFQPWALSSPLPLLTRRY